MYTQDLLVTQTHFIPSVQLQENNNVFHFQTVYDNEMQLMILWNIMLFDLIKHRVYLLMSSAVGNHRAARSKLKCSNSQKMTKVYGSTPLCCMFLMHVPWGKREFCTQKHGRQGSIMKICLDFNRKQVSY